jgi:hypothetical protein
MCERFAKGNFRQPNIPIEMQGELSSHKRTLARSSNRSAARLLIC